MELRISDEKFIFGPRDRHREMFRRRWTQWSGTQDLLAVLWGFECGQVKAMVFPAVTYGCESWTIKKADAFELWYWRRLLKVPWTARRSNQSVLREINLECSLEGLMLKPLAPVFWSSDANR